MKLPKNGAQSWIIVGGEKLENGCKKERFRILLSSPLSLAAESGSVIFDPQAEETSANTHTHSNIRSKLTEASAVQTMTGLLQNTQDWRAAFSVCQEVWTGVVLDSHTCCGSRGCYDTEASGGDSLKTSKLLSVSQGFGLEISKNTRVLF